MDLEIRRAPSVNGERVTVEGPSSGETVVALTAAGALSLVFALLVFFSGNDARVIALFPLLGFLIVLQTRFELSLAALVVCLFVDVHVSLFASAVVYAPLFGIAFVLRYRDIDRRAFANPLSVPLLVYGACILPSFWNAVEPFMSAYKMLNVLSFLIVLYAIVASLHSYEDLRTVLTVYVAAAVINALAAIVEGAAGVPRPFGPAGIMFCDYSGLGVCVMVVITVFSTGKTRLVAGGALALVFVGLALTQTRNSWLATALTCAICGGFIFSRRRDLGLSRRSLARTAAAGALLVLVVSLAIIVVSPGVGTRAASLAVTDVADVDQYGLVHNSLISRAFIWDAALNAFRDHPFIGVGMYGFPYASALYTRLPSSMYNFYVARNSPHQTYFAVLSETGMLGAIGYLVFMIAAIRIAFSTIRRAEDERGRRYAVVAMTALMYIAVSMAFTDAWLWGQGIVLFALVLGGVLTLWKMNSPYRNFCVRA